MKPESLVRRIHFEDFSGGEFERLCFAYVHGLEAWKTIEWYGQLGGDSGRDMWGVRSDGDTVCFQCANHVKLKFEKARADIQKLALGPNGVPKRFVLISGHRVSAQMRDRVKKHATSMGIASAEVWSGEELEERLRSDAPDLIRRFTEGEAFPEGFDQKVLDVFDRLRVPLEFALASRDLQVARPPLAAVLWTKGLFYRHFQVKSSSDDLHGMAVDLSSLSFIAEELVANSAVEIIIPTHSVAALAAAQLPGALRHIVKLVDDRDVCGVAARAVLRPVAHELGAELVHSGSVVWHRNHDRQDHAGALLVVSRSLADLVLGCRYSAEIDVPLTDCLHSLASLRRAVRQPDSRARLALLQGILSAYREVPMSGVAYVYREMRRRTLTFDMLLHDALYGKLAEQWQAIGRPGCGASATRETHRLADELTARSGGELREKRQRVRAAFPTLQRRDMISREVRTRGFLPPVVALDECRVAAQSAWAQAEPEFIPHRTEDGMRAVEWAEEKRLSQNDPAGSPPGRTTRRRPGVAARK